jgi:hypothetical protein
MQSFTKTKMGKVYGNISILGRWLCCVFRELNPASYYTPYVLFWAEVLKRGAILRISCFKINLFAPEFFLF